MATTAAEMIDRLFMLHIRRFGFRVITYLESYTMFVASTINILDLKEGVDEEAAGARLALSLEILRNATSTPSNARCVEIIEELLRKNKRSKEEDSQKQTRSWSQLMGGEQTHNPLPAVTHSPAQAVQAPVQSHAFSPSTMSQMRSVDDFQFMNMPSAELPPLLDQNALANGNGTTPASMLNMQGNSAVETPLRWLADNVNNDHSWMMMDMDFAQDFQAHMFSVDGNVSQRQGDNSSKEH